MIASYGELILNDTVSDNKQYYISNVCKDLVIIYCIIKTYFYIFKALTLAYSQIIVSIEKPVSIWVYFGSALFGFLLLGICIFAFWMVCLFFCK